MCLQKQLPCCVKVCHVPFSGSSLSSDMATQVTCIVFEQCSSKFSSSDAVTCFLLFGGLVFLFPPTRSLSSPSLFDTSVSGTSVPGRVSVKSSSLIFYLNFLFKLYKFRYTIVSQRVSAKPTAKKRGCGDENHRKFPIFKKKRECYMAASVGPKAQ